MPFKAIGSNRIPELHTCAGKKKNVPGTSASLFVTVIDSFRQIKPLFRGRG